MGQPVLTHYHGKVTWGCEITLVNAVMKNSVGE